MGVAAGMRRETGMAKGGRGFVYLKWAKKALATSRQGV